MKDIKIINHTIGYDQRPFIIAEMSGNHNQSLDTALRIVEEASKAGCHALKIQTYTADTMTLDIKDNDFVINEKNSLWNGCSLYELYQKASTPWEWHEQIFKRCSELGMIGFSTPFDETAVDFLESLNVPLYKVASFENTDLPLIKKIAKTGKPMIISTGMATLSEIDESVQTARQSGCKDLILLKCTSTYPSLPADANLFTIPNMIDNFRTIIGLSDHSMGIGTAIASVALGARVIEKHFTIHRNDGGVDADFSMEPEEMKSLVEECLRAFQSLGKIQYGLTQTEKYNKHFRRSLYAVKDIEAGEKFSNDNVRRIRPSCGLAPKYYEFILGKTAKNKIISGRPILWDDLI